MNHVFISYAKEDSELAATIYQNLAEEGVQSWIDTEWLLPGMEWKPVIQKAIREARFFILLLSNHSVSKRGYVQKEIREALEVLDEFPESEIFIIPARVEPCDVTHQRLANLQWVDLFPSYKEGFGKILKTLRSPESQCFLPAQAKGRLSDQPRATPPSNLPRSTDSFVGRDRELRELRELLTEGVGTALITLSGPPGTGKTRLAKEIGRELLSSFPGGCWLADIVESRTKDDIAHAVSLAFGVPLMGTVTPVDGVASLLEFRKPLLLLLDNFEQVVEHAPETIGLWRCKAPQVSFLVTSRSLLGLTYEREYHLDPLPTPVGGGSGMTVTEVGAYGSVRLFVDRARQVRPQFALDKNNVREVGEICDRLDGIPLAIEMAAARVRVLQPAQMLERLNQRFDLLRTSRRDVHRRHRTLLEAIEWSYSLLEPWEKETFLQMSIFRGGFFLDAAEVVLCLSAYPEAPSILDVLQGLVEKNLLKTKDSPYGTRFSMLVSIREYSEEKCNQDLGDTGQQALWQRFTEFYAVYVDAWSAYIHSSTSREALDRLQWEVDNCFAAHSWALQAGKPILSARIILAMGEVLSRRGPVQERIQRLEACLEPVGSGQARLGLELRLSLVDALDNTGEWERGVRIATEALKDAEAIGVESLIAKLLVARSHLLSRRGDFSLAIEGFLHAEKILSKDADDFWLSRCVTLLGWAYANARRYAEAQEAYARAESLAKIIGDPISLASIANNQGFLYSELRELEEALTYFLTAEQIFRELGDQRSCAGPLGNRGMVLQKQKKLTDAIVCLDEAERINREFGNRYWLAGNLNNRAMCYRALIQPRDAIVDYQAAEALNRVLGNRPWLAKNLNNRGLVHMDLEEFDQALACFSEAKDINIAIEDIQGCAYNIGNLGRVLARIGDYGHALSCIAEAEELNRSTGDRGELAENLGNRGRALFDLERFREAREVLLQSLQIYEELRLSSLYRFEFTAVLALVEERLDSQAKSRRLAGQAMQLAREIKLTTEHTAPWFTKLLASIQHLI